MFLFRSLISRIILAGFVVIVAAGAGWYFFIREDNETQKEAAAVSDAVRAAAASPTAAASATAAASSSGTSTTATTAGTSTLKGQAYKIVTAQSSAWYLAPEKLASLPTSSVAKGTTTDVTGEFHLTADGLDSSQKTTFTVNLTKLQSDKDMRDTRVQAALQTSKFPTATFTATKLTGLPAEFGTTDSVMQLTGTLDLHGVQKEVTWELKVKKDASSNILSALGTIQFKYSDFNITKPDIGGFVSVEDSVTLQIQLFAAPA
ncbi:MAG: YceI family protein [Chloroflexi bacterium]|nr:YceI family protein [Chloroflexota bacterium]